MSATDEMRPILAAIAKSDHKYIGIQPQDAVPPATPSILLYGHHNAGLKMALAGARIQWPQCTEWAVIGSDERNKVQQQTWPPDMWILMGPVAITTFATVA